VELHGGKVEVLSKLGEGSRFTVILPDGSSQPFSQPIHSVSRDTAPILSETSETARLPLILLAEDNEANIATLSSYLSAKGCHVLLAKNGQEAIDLSQQHELDLILMDIQMPEVDGLEAIRQIRSQPGRAEIPIIALTALAMPGDRERCLEVGANDYLSKPIKLKQLTAAMRQFLAAKNIRL
jgi:CheY-like chemotaxis protein